MLGFRQAVLYSLRNFATQKPRDYWYCRNPLSHVQRSKMSGNHISWLKTSSRLFMCCVLYLNWEMLFAQGAFNFQHRGAIKASEITTVFYETSTPSLHWESIVSDSTGQRLAAVVQNGGI